jgi:hypothetical protein
MAIVRRDKVKSGYNGNLISLTHTAQMTNGLFMAVSGLVAGERELYQVKTAGLDITADKFWFVNAPEVMYDERLSRLKDFVIPANQPARAYEIQVSDILTLTSDLFSGTVAVGDTLEVDATNNKLKKNVTPTGKLQFKVIGQDALGGTANDSYVVECIKA